MPEHSVCVGSERFWCCGLAHAHAAGVSSRRCALLLTPPCSAAIANMEFVQFHPTSLYRPACPIPDSGPRGERLACWMLLAVLQRRGGLHTLRGGSGQPGGGGGRGGGGGGGVMWPRKRDWPARQPAALACPALPCLGHASLPTKEGALLSPQTSAGHASLISEAVRGEGGMLFNVKGEGAFVNLCLWLLGSRPRPSLAFCSGCARLGSPSSGLVLEAQVELQPSWKPFQNLAGA